MIRWARWLLILLPVGRLHGASVAIAALPPPSALTEPIEVLVGPNASLELAFPYPVADWVGRGFTPDPAKYKGDFLIETGRGQPRVYLTALTPGAHALLHLCLSGTDGTLLSYPFRVVAASEASAWSQITFQATEGHAPAATGFFRMPTERSSPEKELALLSLARLLGDVPPKTLQEATERSGALWCASPSLPPETFDGFSVSLLHLVQDRRTADLGFAARIQNDTPERLWIDPFSWVLRNGDRAYPVHTVDFAGVLEPHASRQVCGVIPSEADEVPPYLDPRQWTLLSARVAARSSPRPVTLYALPAMKRW